MQILRMCKEGFCVAHTYLKFTSRPGCQIRCVMRLPSSFNRSSPRKKWSRGRELNSRPADYESAALPLSYLGPLTIKDLVPRLASLQKTAINLPSSFHRSLSVFGGPLCHFRPEVRASRDQFADAFCWQSPSFPFRNGLS